MRYSTSVLAMLLGLGVYGVGPVIAKADLFGSTSAQAATRHLLPAVSGNDANGDDDVGNNDGDNGDGDGGNDGGDNGDNGDNGDDGGDGGNDGGNDGNDN